MSSSIIKEKKWSRTKFNEYDEQELITFFKQNELPKKEDIKFLSTKLNKAEKVIKVWFQNKRQRKMNITKENNILVKKKNLCNDKKNNNNFTSSQILSNINIDYFEYLKVVLKILIKSYKENKYLNELELSSIHFITNLNYCIIYSWYIFKINYPKYGFYKDLDYLCYLHLIFVNIKY